MGVANGGSVGNNTVAEGRGVLVARVMGVGLFNTKGVLVGSGWAAAVWAMLACNVSAAWV